MIISIFEILALLYLGVITGAMIIFLRLTLKYHLLRRLKNKQDDKELEERLDKIAKEIFEFEKKEMI